ncbi:MAG TPA: CcdC protein domain-containing protein [Candidatus Dormibacteraeota bacterium]|nr:CcdC protein domain-containing protein [Candidatus Dormibacteraeota bacterium]
MVHLATSTNATANQLLVLLVVLAMVSFGVRRRMRPQPVRMGRILVSFGIIVVLIGVSIVGTGGHLLLSSPLGLALVPVSLGVGVALGALLVRTMRFWADPATGQIWMQGGALFAIILVGTIVLRFAVRFLTVGSVSGGLGSPNASGGSLNVLSVDLLCLSLGLWGARALSLWLRTRSRQATKGELPPTPPSEPGLS